jgi:hypothetical protein
MDTFSVPPIRPGAVPQLGVTDSGLSAGNLVQPAWTRLTDVILKVIRYHFGDPTRIEFPSLVDRIYTGQPQDQIVIASLAEWKPDDSNQRPAVLVDRLDQDKDMSTRGIGDQLQGLQQGVFAHFLTGSHVVHCLGGREGEANLLASEVWRDLVRFAPVIRDAACLMRFLPIKIGKRVRLAEEHRDHYSIPLIMVYGYQEAWKLTAKDEAEIQAIRTILGAI